jgi:hypothetical protein
MFSLQDQVILILPLINKCIIDCKAAIYNFVIYIPSDKERKTIKIANFIVKINEKYLFNIKNHPKRREVIDPRIPFHPKKPQG